MQLASSKLTRSILLLILGLFAVGIPSCGRLIYVEGTIHLTDYIDEEDRSFEVEGEEFEPGEVLPIENSPVISIELSSELDEVVVTDEMSATLGIQIDMDSYSGEIDLTLNIKAFISDVGDPQIWSESPAFEITVDHVQDQESSYAESTFDLLERFQDVLHSAEPVFLALEGSVENAGEDGSFSGRVTVQVLDIHYYGHKEL